MLPDTTLAEAVSALRCLSAMPIDDRGQITRRLIRYFFVNPVEMTSCPFLDGETCRIYENRFFGCRAYGLWSKTHYEEISMSAHESKTQLQHQWEALGVRLPEEIISFHQPYCTNVETLGTGTIDDRGLESISKEVESLSTSFSRLHEPYKHHYFSDMSFLMAAATFGIPDAIRMKFEIVKSILKTGDQTRLDEFMAHLPAWLGEPSAAQ